MHNNLYDFFFMMPPPGLSPFSVLFAQLGRFFLPDYLLASHNKGANLLANNLLVIT
jgi:hypothetical protein